MGHQGAGICFVTSLCLTMKGGSEVLASRHRAALGRASSLGSLGLAAPTYEPGGGLTALKAADLVPQALGLH